jgi:Tfp pilus assembly protein FimT
MIELVMVILLIGIIAAFVVPSMGNLTSTKSGSFAGKLRADIRYAQDLAMTRNARARVYFNNTGTAPAAGYAVAQDSSATGNCSSFAAASDPAGGGNLTVTLNAGTYAGITVTPGFSCLEYDSLGKPYNCSGGLGVCSSTSAGMTVTINPSGSVVITDQTGAVN